MQNSALTQIKTKVLVSETNTFLKKEHLTWTYLNNRYGIPIECFKRKFVKKY